MRFTKTPSSVQSPCSKYNKPFKMEAVNYKLKLRTPKEVILVKLCLLLFNECFETRPTCFTF